ncbi:MAG: Glycerate kinase [Rhodoglobus sp.]|nr:Glycerate kinase [Rhodoglobus sp.]
MPFTVVIAPDSFKGSLPAREVAEAIASGWRSVRADDELVLLPQADGGEGTLDAVEAAVPGAMRHRVGAVTGPNGNPTPGEWLELPGGVAVVELAQSSGLPLMDVLDPLGATTRGLGEVIRSALDSGARSLVIGLGGSASTDGAAGALAALGLEFVDEQGELIGDGGGELTRIVDVRPAGMAEAPAGGVTLLTDVTAPLLGPTGAAAVFGPQKGARPQDVAQLDAALAHFARMLGGDPLVAGTGAAGGAGFGFSAVWGAHIESGADYLARLTGLSDTIARADVLLTGEGRFDEQSLTGKVVGQLLEAAARADVRAGVIAGQVTAKSDAWTASLTELAGSVDAALAHPAAWLRAAGAQAAEELSRP